MDWRNHLSDAHHTCIKDGDPLMRAEYATGFKLDGWGRLHELDGSDTDQAYRCVKTLQERYGRYQGKVEGQPLGPLSTIRLPHIKGSTPAGSERGGSGLEEGEAQEEGEDPESFTGIRSGETGTLGRETVLLTKHCPRGWGKH